MTLKTKFFILALLFASKLIGQNTTSQSVASKIEAEIQKINTKITNIRHDIHQNPELGNREFRTSELVAKHLRSLGIEVQTGVAKTGVVGILKGALPGPVLALRADMDGLPVVERVKLPWASTTKTTWYGAETGTMHACGHDTHVAILMGVAEILSNLKAELPGTIKFIFQPAEEGAPKGEEGGAELMVKEGVLENPKVDAIFGLHINSMTEVGKIKYRSGGTMAAVNDMRIVVKGTSSHGAQPWASVDPIVVAAQIINNLQTIVSRNVNITDNAAVVTIGSIKGGNRSNIIPEEVEMMGTIRALSSEDEALIIKRIHEIAEGTAKQNGATATVEIPYASHYPVTYNDPSLTAAMLPSLQQSIGASQVSVEPPRTGAEDFSFFAQKVPGFFYFLGGMPKGQDPAKAAPHHTPDFYVDDTALAVGMTSMTNLVFDYMQLNKPKPNINTKARKK
jgi:amidohydrolase